MKIIKQIDSHNHTKGFTLIETLIYVALIGGAIVSFITFIISISNSRNKVYVKQEVQANARIALNLINQTIKSANDVNVASSTFAIDPGILSLSMDDAGENPTIINLNENDGVLQIKKGNNPVIAVTSDEVKIINLVFTNLTGDNAKENIRVGITVEYKNDESVFFQYSTDVQTAVNLRQ